MYSFNQCPVNFNFQGSSVPNAPFMTISAYASSIGRKVDLQEAKRLGKAASKLSRSLSVPIFKTTDERYGSINTYHDLVLQQVFNREFKLTSPIQEFCFQFSPEKVEQFLTDNLHARFAIQYFTDEERRALLHLNKEIARLIKEVSKAYVNQTGYQY